MDKYYNDVKDSELIKNFLLDNPGKGTLKIRASSLNQAYPVSNLKVDIIKKIGNDNIIFFEGYTDNSGMINNIILPTPKRNDDIYAIPGHTEYEIKAYVDNKLIQDFYITMYNAITVIQDINVVPNMRYYYGY